MKEAKSPDFQYPIVFLPCLDLKPIRDFYEGALSLPVALDQGSCLIFRVGAKPTRGYWGFCSGIGPQLTDPEKVCLTLVVSTREEVDRWHTKLTRLSVTCTKTPGYRAQFHIYNAFFRDPMNYTVEIQAFDTEYEPQ